jgi:transposase
MPRPKAIEIELSKREEEVLERLCRRRTGPQQQVKRAEIILKASKGLSNEKITEVLKISRSTVGRWRKRWSEATKALAEMAKEAEDKELLGAIESLLSDAYRPGVPPKFSAEQVVQIMALACEEPSLSDKAFSHWTAKELAKEAVRRKLVASISPQSVERFLKEASLKPHLSRYWLTNERDKDPEAFDQDASIICELYAQAQTLHEQGVHVVSTDEKTAIQALEPKHPKLAMKPGQVERREFEYIRHGTQTLIANFEVATGQVISPSLGQTRKEDNFAAHIERTLATDAQASWIFILDRLNTHQSEALVRLVQHHCHVELSQEQLGLKGKSGILHNMKTRRAFLANPEHRIRFVYTPKHASWLNQIEIWFSILVRRLLKRSSFCSTQDLRQKILDFIVYFNTMAKPFKWTYAAKPLCV